MLIIKLFKDYDFNRITDQVNVIESRYSYQATKLPRIYIPIKISSKEQFQKNQIKTFLVDGRQVALASRKCVWIHIRLYLGPVQLPTSHSMSLGSDLEISIE